MKPSSSLKYRLGPGGLTCACCTKGHPRKWKHKHRRAERRVFKVDLKHKDLM